MDHRFINELIPGEQIDDVYMIANPILRSTTRGDLYIAMFLSDRTGRVNGRMWQATEKIYNALPQAGFVHLQGKSELYQNNLQIVVNHISVIDAGRVQLEDYLGQSSKDTGQMFDEMKSILNQIKNKQLRLLVREFLNDGELMKRFCRAPAAVKLHHNYLGGLLEHTHNMLRVASALLPFYPEVQADLVLAGILVHDIGKTVELTYETAFSYTDSGQLVGHLAQGLLILNKKAEELSGKGQTIDRQILDALGHIILSHHGQYEFGSPKLPATAEAFMVSYVDNLDAKINQVSSAIANESNDSNWTSWQKSLETRLYKKRLGQ